jgi:hypothetical protein
VIKVPSHDTTSKIPKPKLSSNPIKSQSFFGLSMTTDNLVEEPGGRPHLMRKEFTASLPNVKGGNVVYNIQSDDSAWFKSVRNNKIDKAERLKQRAEKLKQPQEEKEKPSNKEKPKRPPYKPTKASLKRDKDN